MQSKLIDKQGRNSVTDVVKIRNLQNNIPDIIKKSIAPHLTEDRTHTDIVTNKAQSKGANQGSNAEHTNPGFRSRVSGYSHTSSTRCSYAALQSKPDQGQPLENRLRTSGVRSTASAANKDAEWDKIWNVFCE